MADARSLEPAIDPNHRIGFLLDWELTMKCNLDCSYCGQGIYGGHDNTTKHPPLPSCYSTIDFMFQYADLYMQQKTKGLRYVVLNVYGGEALHHPDIVAILKRINEVYTAQYQSRWHLTVTTTTNAIIQKKKLQDILPFIDEFTVSYHSENTDKQKNMFKSNINEIVSAGKRVKCVILMHSRPDLFEESQLMIDWCMANQITALPRQLDHSIERVQFNYLPQQVIWFDKFYKEKSYNSKTTVDVPNDKSKVDLSDMGRSCCGGRLLCKDQSYKSRDSYVVNKFPDWFCSVNEFFLYIKQVNGEIYTNKDCKMNFHNQVGPIGHLSDSDQLLRYTRDRLMHNRHAIQCQKTRCLCGLCAPKAQHRHTFDKIMEKYRI